MLVSHRRLAQLPHTSFVDHPAQALTLSMEPRLCWSLLLATDRQLSHGSNAEISPMVARAHSYSLSNIPAGTLLQDVCFRSTQASELPLGVHLHLGNFELN